MRLSSPITGPAHQIAHDAGESSIDSRTSGLTPIASRTATLVTICTAGPANEMPACSSREIGRVGRYEAYPARKFKRDLGVGACGPGGDGVTEFVDEREDGERSGEPEAELAAVQERR